MNEDYKNPTLFEIESILDDSRASISYKNSRKWQSHKKQDMTVGVVKSSAGSLATTLDLAIRPSARHSLFSYLFFTPHIHTHFPRNTKSRLARTSIQDKLLASSL